MIEAAVNQASERLSDLPRNESVRILTSAPYPVWGETGASGSDRRSRERIQAQLRQMKATEGSSDLLATLFAAVQAEHDPTQSSRKILVLTDGQAADWRLEDEFGWKRLREVLSLAPVRTDIETVWLGDNAAPTAAGNIAIENITVGSSIVGRGQLAPLTVQLKNYGETTHPASRLTWKVDGVEKFDEEVDSIDAGQTIQANWQTTFDTPGTYEVTCVVESDDELLADNRADLVVEVVEQIPIVIVEDAFELAEMQQDSYFVQAALGWINGDPLDHTSIYVPTLVSPDELGTVDLASQRVVVIPNLTRMDDDVVDRLTDFVNAGGGLWIGLGPRTDIDSFNHALFADASGLSPLRIDRIVDSGSTVNEELGEQVDAESSQRDVRIDPFRSEHPATRQLADDKQLDLADALIQRRFQFLTSERTDELSVLLRLNNGQPLAVENFVGRGRVIVQAVPLRLQWSDLARTQSFVVMVRDWIDYLAQPRATQFNLQPGEPIVMKLQESTLDVASQSGDEAPTALLTTPAGNAIELAAEYRDDGMVFRTSRTRLPGQYALEIGLTDQKIPFHVQRDNAESDLRRLSADAEKQIAIACTPDPSPERLAATASTQSDPLWPYLLIGLIMLITGELVLSGVLARERFGSAGVPEFAELESSQMGAPVGLEGSSAFTESDDLAHRVEAN